MARTMRAVEITKPGTPFKLVEKPIPEAGRGQVRIAVEACGICHSDAFVKEGHFPGVVYPRVPGHEVVGRVDAVGEGVTVWKPGQRVGVGWHGGHDGVCEACRAGDFILCEKGLITGFSYDGGYAEYMVAPQEALAAVHAIGGLGHLGIQYARKLGFRTVALSRGADKRALALELGAHEYIDTNSGDPAAALQRLGGARVILATAPSAQLAGKLVDGLARNGTLVVLGATPEPIQVSPLPLIGKRRRIQGWPSGTAKDSEETLAFSALSGVASRNEVFPLEKAEDAYQRMMSNKARFRVVIQVRS